MADEAPAALLVAGTAPALALCLVLGAVSAPVVLALAVLLVQGLLASGWHGSLRVPGRFGGIAVAVAAALAADALVLADDGDRPLAVLPGLLALAVVAGVVHQIARRDGRAGLVPSLTATVTLVAFVVLAVAAVAAEASEGGAPLVAAAALPAGLVPAGAALRRHQDAPGWLDVGVVVVVPLVVALLVVVTTELNAVAASAVAAGAAGAAWAAGLLVGRTPAPAPSVAAALPLALAGPTAYVLGRLLVG